MDPETEARIERAREERRRREASQRAKPVERDVYLPFSLSVASLAKLVGRRLATVQRVIKQAGLPHNEAVHRALPSLPHSAVLLLTDLLSPRSLSSSQR